MAATNHLAAAPSTFGPPRVVRYAAPKHGIFTIWVAIFAIRHSHTRYSMHEAAGLEETTRGVLEEPGPRLKVLDDF